MKRFYVGSVAVLNPDGTIFVRLSTGVYEQGTDLIGAMVERAVRDYPGCVVKQAQAFPVDDYDVLAAAEVIRANGS